MIQRSSGAEAWHGLKLATVQHCMGDRRGAAQSLVECVASVGGLAEREAGGQGAAGLTWATGRCNILLYTCTVMTTGHWQGQASQVPAADQGRSAGLLLQATGLPFTGI